jgi:hypothetical protein
MHSIVEYVSTRIVEGGGAVVLDVELEREVRETSRAMQVY